MIDDIIKPTLEAAQSYSGILYAGLMLTATGPKLLEYNARFGDPETQVIVSRLKTDLLSVLIDIAEHRLASRALWSGGRKPQPRSCSSPAAIREKSKTANKSMGSTKLRASKV